ncbi:MAG TPA: DUF4386 domain-containing protein [Brevundimonas sp.]
MAPPKGDAALTDMRFSLSDALGKARQPAIFKRYGMVSNWLAESVLHSRLTVPVASGRPMMIATLSQPGARPPIQRAQYLSACIVGVVTLVTMAVSIWVEFVALSAIVTSDDAAVTAASIAGGSQAIRQAAVLLFVCFISDLAVGVAAYVVLSPISHGLAMLGVLFRVANAAVLSASALALIVALRLVSDAPYLEAFTLEQQQALARLVMGVRADTMSFGWVFLGLGQATFAWLWFQSRYIPRALAVLGIGASTALAVVPLIVLVRPEIGNVIGIAFMAPMFFYEVLLGLLLVTRGIRPGKADIR